MGVSEKELGRRERGREKGTSSNVWTTVAPEKDICPGLTGTYRALSVSIRVHLNIHKEESYIVDRTDQG